MKEIVIDILNHEWKVIVVFGNHKQVLKVLNAWGYPDKDIQDQLIDRRGVCFMRKGCAPVIAMPTKPKTAEQIGTLAHEATHAVEDIFYGVQQPLGGEVFAHSVGAIVRIVLKKVGLK